MSKAENNVEIFLKNVGEFLYVKVKTPWEAQDCRSPRRNAITEICEADEEDNCLKIQIDKKNMKVKGGGRIYELENQEHYDKINKLLEKENLVFFAQAEDSCGRRYFLKIYWLKNEGLENVTQNIEDVVVQGFRRESHLPLITSPFLSQILGCYSNREEIKLKEEQAGIHYVLYEEAPGNTLRKWVEEKNRLREEEPQNLWECRDRIYIRQCLSILRQLLFGLNDMQSITPNGHFVHRDISPGNVMIEEDKESAKVRLKYIDFGLSSLKSREDDHETGKDIGTPGYSGRSISDLSSVCRIFYYLINPDVIPNKNQDFEWESLQMRKALEKAGILQNLETLEAILKLMYTSPASEFEKAKASLVISEYENWLKKQNGVWEDEDLYFSELEKCTVVLDSDSKRKGQTLKKLKVYLRHENTVKCFELENGRGSFLNSDDCFYRGERKDLAYLYLRMKNLEPECGIYGMDKNLNLKNKERLRAGDRLCWYTPECEEKVWEVTGIFEKESWDDNI